ncbi:hypothetical protein ABZ837_20525 [Streptomyces sp. NPDC047197]|uniref:hypothetical protein n=1 Tax=Streptomyces sp. NPDC047197 TaxID=3155477 RepID=UPI0033C95B14
MGARVPSVVELASEFGIAASTAQKALTHLKTKGSSGPRAVSVRSSPRPAGSPEPGGDA